MVVFLLPCILDIMGLHSAHMSVGVACKWANKYAQLSPMTYAYLIHTGMERLCLRAACVGLAKLLLTISQRTNFFMK